MRAATTHVAELILGLGEPGAETSALELRAVEVPVAYARIARRRARTSSEVNKLGREAATLAEGSGGLSVG